MPEDLQVTVRREGEVGIVHVGGEVRLEIATRLRRAGHELLETGARHLLLGLKGVLFMDSASLAALIGLDQEARERDGRLVLFSPSSAVERVLTNSGLDRRFTTVADEAAARALLSV